MPAATQVITSFLGGEISELAQGRFDKPDYRTSMRVCFNAFPLEAGAWGRRPGTQHAGHTRGGAPGRVIKFDSEQAAAFTLELVDGYMRFRSGAVLIKTNDSVGIVSISLATPAVVQVAAAVTWQTNDQLMFPVAAALLDNRQFIATRIDSTHFSIADALTGVGIDGTQIGTLAANATVARIQQVTTPYVGGSWANIRAVQAETTDILICNGVKPQALTVQIPSATTGNSPVFSLADCVFNDGPYLDPFTDGVEVTPSALNGNITLTLAFQPYVATQSYPKGALVSSSSINYQSLVDANSGNTPASSPSFWQVTSVTTAINNGLGFLGTDIGRPVRLFSEPPAWLIGSSYTAGSVVSYNPSGLPGATTYWQALTSTTGNAPGSDLTHWQIVPSGAAVWTWGKITGLSNIISPSLSGSVAIGDMVNSSAAFNGTFSQPSAVSAQHVTGASGSFPPGTPFGQTNFVGKNYSGASNQKIQQATVFPSNDKGFAVGTYVAIGGAGYPFSIVITLNLRAKASVPASSSDGTLLGTSGPISNQFAAITIVSSDQSTAWPYVWIEEVVTGTTGVVSSQAMTMESYIAQISFYNPPGTGTGTGCTIEILGPPLLYTNPVVTWRMGVFSDTTGWPTCGLYVDGRIYLGGAVANRFDASVANGISGGTINFAPTDQYGVVAASNAISYTFNSDGVNPIEWMSPDLQGILMGTQAGEWLVQAPTAGPIAPANITARNVTHHGSANIQPCRTEHTTVFVQRFGKKLLEYFPDVYSGKFSAPNLADKASHIVKNKAAELAYTSAVTPILWGRDTIGALFGITYKRDSLSSAQPPTFYGWHRHALGSGRVVESICAGPSVGGDLDALTMVTNDAATGIRHVEVLTDTPEEDADLSSAWQLDDAVVATSITSVAVQGGAPYGGVTLNGLWHLNGKTVQVFAGGLDCGDRGEGTITDFVVANGAVLVPFGDGLSVGCGAGLFTADFYSTGPQIVVGFTYNSDGRIVRLVAQADTGARNGPALGAPSRSHRAAVKFVNSRGVSIGGNFDRLYPCEFKAGIDSVKTLPALSLYTGIFYDQVKDDFTYDDSFSWRVSRPFPAVVTAIAVNLRTEDM